MAISPDDELLDALADEGERVEAEQERYRQQMSGWRTGRPADAGYYLAAWQFGDRWVVSEMWFNPDSTGTGWWTSRGYFLERHHPHETMPVQAWMPMPSYQGSGDAPVLSAPDGVTSAAALVRDILEALCNRAGLSLDSAADPGQPARNYELADRLGIGAVFGMKP